MHILETREFKPGDLPPTGYLDWHEWAEVQQKAGIKQVQCGQCGRWKTPQELSEKILKRDVTDGRGRPLHIESPLCTNCCTETDHT